jgi:hypothetical protein
MIIRHPEDSSAPRRKRRSAALKSRLKHHERNKRRRLGLEQLEDRMLLAIGPQLIGINPNNGAVLQNNDVRTVAPVDLTFRFDDGQQLNPSTLAQGIRITSGGADKNLATTVDNVVVTPGFIGLGDVPNEVIVRFSERLPDNIYRIDVIGTGTTPLRNISGVPFRDPSDDGVDGGADQNITFRLNLGAQVISVVPQPVSRNIAGGLQQARDEIHVYFNDDDLDPASATNRQFYQLIFTNDTVRNTDDTVYLPTTVTYSAALDRAVLKFAAPLDQLGAGAGTFRLRIGTNEALPLAPANFQLDSTVTTDFNTGGAVRVSFRALVSVENGNPITLNFTKAATPTAVTITGRTINVVLNSAGTTAAQLATLINTTPGVSGLVQAIVVGGLAGTNIAAPAINYSPLILVDAGSSFVSAQNLGQLGTQSQIITSTIDPQLFPLDLPGAVDEPGHRDIRVQTHVNQPSDTNPGVETVFYNFRDDYGIGPAGPLHNVITEAQKQRSREIFQLYSTYIGVQFIEEPGPIYSGTAFTIVTGDLFPLAPPGVFSAPGGVLGLAGASPLTFFRQTAIMDNAEVWDDSFGSTALPGSQSWFQTAMHEIGHLLGQGHTDELPPITVQNDEASLLFNQVPDPFFPGDNDIVHGLFLHRNESKDIDLYRFEIPVSAQIPAGSKGLFTAETFAERRQPDSSTLDTVLRLYREVGGQRVLVAQNDNYYSKDSYLELQLEPGVYYIGVSASGNDQYDPSIEDSGFFGTTQGTYDLRLNFRPQALNQNILRDLDKTDGNNPPRIGTVATSTAFDGDNDGTPGGVYNYWFQAQPLSRVLDVTGSGLSFIDGQTITITSQRGITKRFEIDFNPLPGSVTPGNIRVGVTSGSSSAAIASALFSAIDGQRVADPVNFNVTPTLNSTRITLTGDRSVVLSAGFQGIAIRAKTIFVDKAFSDPANAPPADGSLANPFNNINTAFAAAQPGDIVRIVGNGGVDGKIETLGDNRAYEIGFLGTSGLTLADGSTMEVPKGVMVMIDAGAEFKLRAARIGVGSSSSVVDRSRGALQVLGTPFFVDSTTGGKVLNTSGQIARGSVIFTSYDDESIGVDTNPLPQTPRSGDYGGIVFRNDIDRASGRFEYERQGIFLNYVNHADMRFGGGQVNINSSSQVISPIHMIEARPTVSFNIITRSADAAMSADPNSFEETNFHAPRSQMSGAFTSDYTRVGPDIDGNRLVGNSFNALFVRIVTAAGQPQKPLSVVGRFDDTDVVHVITDNLLIRGTAGGPAFETAPPPVTLVTLTSQPAGGLDTRPGFVAGTVNTYNYRIVFVDRDGNQSPASVATLNRSLVPGQGTIRLNNIPTTSGEYVARRIYRSDPFNPALGPYTGKYTLVAQIDGTLTSFIDDGTTAGGLLPLQASAAGVIRPRLDARLAVDPGIVTKLKRARIETSFGANFIAEGVDGRAAIFTSVNDDRFGAAGTFDTGNDFDVTLGASRNLPAVGDWAGIFVGHSTTASIDHALFAYGGGLSPIEGRDAAFNVLEIHQAKVRVTNSLFDLNAEGKGGDQPANDDRFGRGFNAGGAIFVRASQPILINNIIRNTVLTAEGRNKGERAPAININVNSLNSVLLVDYGRATGKVDRFTESGALTNNQGPLIRLNKLGRNDLNGMVVRGGTLTTQGVWDDTDMAHIVFNEILVPDFHTFGGLRLKSSPTQSLVVKLEGLRAGFTATGRPLDIDDRAGGSLAIVGQPGFPVVLTALADDTVGAGFDPQGRIQNDTNGDALITRGLPTGPEVNNGLLIDDDVPIGIPGQFAARIGNAGASGTAVAGGAGGGISAQGNTTLFSNTDVIFEFLNYVDVGPLGAGINLATTTITQPPTLIAPDVVTSQGQFTGANGLVNWLVRSEFQNGVSTLFNTITFTSATPLGALRFINYLDEDILGFTDDILVPTGTPGQANFRALTLDNPERIGFSQGGIYQAGPGLVNATYDGWAADSFANLRSAITGAGTAFSVPGNINTVNLPPFIDPQLGTVFGPRDVTTAFAWSVDPNSTSATVTSFLELVATNPGSTGQPGDWRSIKLDQFSHDRNVETITELEAPDVTAPGSNALVGNAQFMGHLAPFEKSGDDNLRLGFEIRGLLNAPNDIDVYSFEGSTGTEVWLDIDKTTHALDTVIELLNASGQVLARSVNSLAESADPSLLFTDGNTQVFRMQKQPPFLGKDHWSTNPRDAGMRVILPGPQNSTNTYHVRVRSNGPDLSDLQGGVTSGAYQLQIRLREIDEIPGSTVRFADIRFATNGIEVLGLPIHSPLIGEAVEVEGLLTANDTQTTAQVLGNLLSTDRAALAVAGRIATATDVDFYQFDVTYDSVQSQGNLLSTIFDIDYADGLGRSDVSISVFDSAGRLVLTSRDSNVGEDRPGPIAGSAVSDLTRGSVGSQDPYIGTVELPVGTYFVAVYSNSSIPTQLQQFFSAAASNPLMRLEPINSINRIVEDHLEPTPLAAMGTANPPQVSVLLDPTSAIPFNLGDVSLFVSQSFDTFTLGSGGIFDTRILTVDPFTGAVETVVNSGPSENVNPAGNSLASFETEIRDIAFRSDNGLFAFSVDERRFVPLGTCSVAGAVPCDANSGNYLQINPGDGTVTNLGDDGIVTFERDPASAAPGTPQVSHVVNTVPYGYGVQFEALTFGNLAGAERLIAVGHRGDAGLPGNLDVALKDNILYHFDTNTGVALGNTKQQTLFDGDRFPVRGNAATDATELGEIITASRLTAVDATTFQPTLNPPTVRRLIDGQTFTVDDGSSIVTFEFDSGPEVVQNINVPLQTTVRDGNFFFLDGNIYQLDTGTVISINRNGTGMPDGTVITVTGFVPGVGNRAASFELRQPAPPAPAMQPPPRDPLATAIPIGPGTTQAQIASALATGIAGAMINVQASAGGSRITLIGDINVQINLPPTATGQEVTLEGTRGLAPIIQITDASALVDGDFFQIRSDVFVVGSNATTPVLTRFVFDDTNIPGTPAVAPPLAANEIAVFVQFNSLTPPGAAFNAQVASNINAAVAGIFPRLTSQLVGDKVVINGQAVSFVSTTNNAALASLTITQQILVEESDIDDVVGQSVRRDVNAYAAANALTLQVGASGARINFLNALTSDFSGVPVWVDQGTTTGVAPGNERVIFLVEDTAIDRIIVAPPSVLPGIATRVATAINATLNPTGLPNRVIATASRQFVRLNFGTMAIGPWLTATIPAAQRLQAIGSGPGGRVTGVAVLNGQTFAVSDEGGLFRVNINFVVPPPFEELLRTNTTYVNSSADDLRVRRNVAGQVISGIQFAGLVAGPSFVEGGRYNNLLFGVDVFGRLYAFNTQGVLQPIFQDGQTSVLLRDPVTGGSLVGPTNAITGLPARPITGLAFSSLNRNLWHITPMLPTLIDERQLAPTGAGHGINVPFDGSRVGSPGFSSYTFSTAGVGSTFDFPGGAYGTLVTNEFSLKGYQSSDRPVLYFNYFESDDRGTLNFDSFRVFATDDSGVWSQLPANTFANTSDWRQARVALDGLAGRENLRLRFEFTTAGDMNVGDPLTTGDELRAVAGTKLRDGQTFQIGTETFEFEMGFTVVTPSGAVIRDGETFTVSNGVSSITYEFDNTSLSNGLLNAANRRVPYNIAMTPDQLAQAINASFVGPAGVTLHVNGNRIQFEGAQPVTSALGPEINNFNLIDNDIPAGFVGQFSFNVLNGGATGSGQEFPNAALGGATAQGDTLLLANQNFLHQFLNYVDVGSDGGAIDLSKTTITLPSLLVAPDVVISQGRFLGSNGTIDWTVRTSFNNGSSTVQNQVTFASANPTGSLGNLRFINYLNQNVVGAASANDDILRLDSPPLTQSAIRIFPLEDDGNITVPTLTALTTGGSVLASARIGDAPAGVTLGDYDWYRVPNVMTGQVITVNVTAFQNLNSAVGIYNSAGVLQVSDTRAAADSQLTFRAPSPDNYFVVVHGGSGFQTNVNLSNSGSGPGSTGDYQIVIGLDTLRATVLDNTQRVGLGHRGVYSAGPELVNATYDGFAADAVINAVLPISPLPVEDNGSLTTAVQTGIGGGRATVIARGVIGDAPATVTNGDYDIYRIDNVQIGQVISAFVDSRSFGATLNSAAGIYNSTGTLMAVDTSIREDSFVKFTVAIPGTYYVVVHGGTAFQTNVSNSNSGSGVGTTGTYEVTIGVDSFVTPIFPAPAEDNGSRPLATDTGLVGLNAPGRGRGQVIAQATIGDAPPAVTRGDFDWYKISSVKAGQVITVDVSAGSFGGLVSSVGIYSSTSGAPLVADTNPFNANSILRFTAPLNDDYYVVVHGGTVFQTNPLDSNSGPGVTSGGNYQISIGLDFEDLRIRIERPDAMGAMYSTGGMTTIDTADLPSMTDPQLMDTVYGPENVSTAFAWTVDPTATTATITTFVDLIAQNPAAIGGGSAGVTLGVNSGLKLEGSIGVLPGRHLVRVNSSLTRDQVANVIDAVLEPVWVKQEILALNGSQFADGDTFNVFDGNNTLTFEFDSGYVLQVPPNGGNPVSAGIADGDTFAISGFGTTVIFEFDNDMVVNTPAQTLPNRLVVIPYTNNDSALTISRRIESAVLSLPAAVRTLLGLLPRLTTGGIQLVGAVGTNLTITPVTPVPQPFTVGTMPDNDATRNTANVSNVVGRSAGFTTATIGDQAAGVTTGDYDWFQITGVSAGQVISVTVTPQAPPTLNPRIAIYDAAGNLPLATAIGTGPGTSVSLTFTALSSGNFFVVVTGNNGFQTNPNLQNSGTGVNLLNTGDYRLDISLTGGLLSSGLRRTTGVPGVNAGNQRVFFTPSADFTSAEMAQAIAAAFNSQVTLNANAVVNSFTQRRVTINRPNLVVPKLTLLPGLSRVVTAPTQIFPVEDNGATFSATPTGLTVGNSVIAAANVGNGPFGATSGDYDWYRINNVPGGQVLRVDVNVTTGGLQPVIGIYDVTGMLLTSAPAQPGNNAITFAVPATGDYFVVVHGSPEVLPTNPLGFQTNPANSGSGSGVGTTGDYIITMELSTNNLVPLTLEVTNNVVKNYKDLIRIIGRKVVNPGPLGLQTNPLPGDLTPPAPAPPPFGNPFGVLGVDRIGFNDPRRGQANNFEGVYIDDFIIGFVERGEMATATVSDSTFVASGGSLGPPVGEYQLEVRRGTDYLFAPPIAVPSLPPNRGFDTNDRLNESYTIVVPPANRLVDGQTFTLSDGVNTVTFEFDDVTLGNMVSIGNGVTQGNQPVVFNPAVRTVFNGGASVEFTPEPDFVIARRLRDLINSSTVQNVLKVSAASGDGKVPFTEALSGVTTTDNRINLFGAAVVQLLPTLTVTSTTTDGNALRDTLLGPGITTIGSATLVSGNRSAGFFIGGSSTIGIESGILLTTGDAKNAEGPNTDDAFTAIASGAGDPLPRTDPRSLDSLLPVFQSTRDSTILEFQFQFGDGTVGGDLFFNFVFASEEYNEFANSGFNDVFGFFLTDSGGTTRNLALIPTTTIPVTINTVNGGNPFGVGAVRPQFYNNNDPSDGGLFLPQIGFDGFTTVFTAQALALPAGVHTIRLAISDVGDTALDSGVFIQARSFTSGLPAASAPAGIGGIVFNDIGDENRFRDQGQILIHSNVITDSQQFGIVSDAGARSSPNLVPLAGPLPHPGGARNLEQLNFERLAPGVVIANNIVARSGSGGIRVAGDPNPAGTQLASVPFARVINNTLFGKAANDVGIDVGVNASPTLLNNIVANFATGVRVNFTSTSTVMQGSLYQNNLTNTVGIGLGQSAIPLGPNDPLFVDAAGGNFYLKQGSRAIDSSIYEVQDRFQLTVVRDPLGIARSPILVPDRDVFGQLRVDDGNTQNTGSGQKPFFDRGALDRVDFVGPSLILLNPRDNDALGVDKDPAPTIVELDVRTILTNFSLQFIDGIAPNDPSDGTGVDDRTVSRDNVSVFFTGQLLTEGVDYIFSYDATNNVMRLTPLTGIWLPGTYVIKLNTSDNQFLLTAPAGSTLRDGDSFQISDATRNVTFEFDSGFNLQLPGSLFIQVPQTLTLQVPVAGGNPVGGIVDQETFTITSGGVTSIFEFDSNNNLTVAGAIPVPFTAGATPSTQAQIALNILTALQSAAAAPLGLSPRNLGNGQIHIGGGATTTLTTGPVVTQIGVGAAANDGDTFIIANGGVFRTFEFDIGNGFATGNINVNFTNASTQNDIANAIVAAVQSQAVLLGVNPVNATNGAVNLNSQANTTANVTGAPTLTASVQASGVDVIQVPAAGGGVGGVVDAQTFTITQGPLTVRFEFDNNNSFNPANRRIAFSSVAPISTADQIANAIVAAIQGTTLGLTPQNIGSGQVTLGATSNQILNITTAPSLTRFVLNQVVADGETFTITNGANSFVFEFDNNGIRASASNIAVPFNNTSTVNDVANAIVTAVNGTTTLGLSATNVNNGRIVNLGGTTSHTLNTNLTSLTQFGQPGVNISGAIAVPFSPLFTAGQTAAAITTAINSATSLGRLTNVQASVRGTSNVFVSGVTNISGLSFIPIPGVKDVAGNPLKANQLTGETTFTIIIGNGVDFGDAPDGVGTSPQNRYPTLLRNDGARHTIIKGFSLGATIDADPNGQPTVAADGDDSNGQDDEDGVIFNTAFAAGQTATITVTVTLPTGVTSARLDAWVDFNRDGDWNDPLEQIFTSQIVVAGPNTLSVPVPVTAASGMTYARFRLSTAGGLLPTGLADDGEVEDYKIANVFSQTPWQNSGRTDPTNPACGALQAAGNSRFDVDDNCRIAPLDAFILIDFLRRNGPQVLPLPTPSFGPPPFLDVGGGVPDSTKGDNRITNLDVFQVIGFLRSPAAAGEGEGSGAEGEGGSLIVSPQTSTSSSSSATTSQAGSSQAVPLSGLAFNSLATPVVPSTSLASTAPTAGSAQGATSVNQPSTALVGGTSSPAGTSSLNNSAFAPAASEENSPDEYFQSLEFESVLEEIVGEVASVWNSLG